MGANSRTAAEPRRSGGEDAEQLLLFHDEVLLAVEVDLAPGVLAEEHAISRLDREGGLLARLGDLALADRDDSALLRFLLCGVGDDDAAAPRGCLFDPLE